MNGTGAAAGAPPKVKPPTGADAGTNPPNVKPPTGAAAGAAEGAPQKVNTPLVDMILPSSFNFPGFLTVSLLLLLYCYLRTFLFI